MYCPPRLYWRPRNRPARAPPVTHTRIPAAPGMADLCLVWPGTLDEVLAHLAAHGVEVELGPVPRNGAGGPGQSVYFRDPDGSLVEFIVYR